MQTLSKSQFKPKALEVMRQVEQTGQSVIITDHGRPALELRVYCPVEADPFARLHGSVVAYHQPTEPVADDLWEAAG